MIGYNNDVMRPACSTAVVGIYYASEPNVVNNNVTPVLDGGSSVLSLALARIDERSFVQTKTANQISSSEGGAFLDRFERTRTF